MSNLRKNITPIITMFLLSAAAYTMYEPHDVTYMVYSVGGNELEKIELNHEALEAALKDNRCLSLAQLREITTVPESLCIPGVKFTFNPDQSMTVVKVDKFKEFAMGFYKLPSDHNSDNSRLRYLNTNPDVVARASSHDCMRITLNAGLLGIRVYLPEGLNIQPSLSEAASSDDMFDALERLVNGQGVECSFVPQVADDPDGSKSQRVKQLIEAVVKDNISEGSQVDSRPTSTNVSLPPKKVLQLFRALDAAVNTPEILQATLS